MEVHIPGFDLALTAASGQCFRFNMLKPGEYSLVALGQHLMIRALGQDSFEFSCSQAQFDTRWRHYFDLQRDYQAVCAQVHPDGSYLHRAVQYAGGLRILRQQPFETLISFIISQRKNIPAIKACVENLSSRFGQQIQPGTYAFPEPEALAMASETELSACGLGYRTPYIKNTARIVDSGSIDLEDISKLPDEVLKNELLRFPGVGVKVASCVMLFAYARMDAFPVDVWIERVLQAEYPQGFPVSQYAGVSGILQQHLFCYARQQARAGQRE